MSQATGAHRAEAAAGLAAQGYGIISPDQFRIDIEPDFKELWQRVQPFTMTSLERGYALYQAVRYLADHAIPGSLVECGVWKGGSCMIMAMALLARGDKERTIYLYDTFTGMPEPTDHDRIAWNGRPVREKWEADQAGRGHYFTGWAVGADEVLRNLRSVGWPESRTVVIEGDVGITLDRVQPDRIALLRLDTDWYESTAVELDRLYPRLTSGGVLIIDDYGHFVGARKAVDDYFADPSRIILLNRVDYTGRVGVKIA
jgi:O-methyltransferase